MTDKLESNHIQENSAEKEQDHSKGQVAEQNETLFSSIRLVRLRLIPIWLRIVLVVILLIVTAIVGVMAGYSVIGDGALADALKASTWQHIFDIMNGKE